jgi:hypothetical protein
LKTRAVTWKNEMWDEVHGLIVIKKCGELW